MTTRRLLALCLVFAMLAGTAMAMTSCKSAEPPREGSGGGAPKPSISEIFSRILGISGTAADISSDGEQFTIAQISGITVATEIPEGGGLPAVGDRETLLKLLLDRGALYDDSGIRTMFTDEAEEKMFWAIGGTSGRGGVQANDDSPAPVPVPESVPDTVPESVPQVERTENDAMDAAAEAPAMAADSGSGSGGYSQTNEQVEGVSEGDIVKTDGSYIYALSPSSSVLRIIRANGADLELASTIYNEDTWGSEFYIVGKDRLVMVCNENAPIRPLPADEGAPQRDERTVPYYGWYSNSFTTFIIYDISDRWAPAEIRRVSMEGWAVSTRVIGSVAYMVTNKYIYSVPYDQADSPHIMPYTRDTAEGETFEPVGLDRIFYIPDSRDSSYLMIGATDVYGDEPFQPTAYLGAGSSFYMSQNAMYVTKDRWEQENAASGGTDWMAGGRQKTDIMRFAISGTNVGYAGVGTVDGFPISQYSMDEHNGYFRIASTDWSRGTYVTVLDASNMRAIGRTEALAPGETMQSMRFMGDMGYIVTFLNMDPLFTVDLADPRNPKVLGELKVPGFSQYLHPVGDGLMMGIGRQTQEIYTRDSQGVETVVGNRDAGMKISLFDVSDPFDPFEADVLLLNEGWSEISHNPRALMCDPARGLYGFIVESWDNNSYWTVLAHILRVEGDSVTIAATLEVGGYVGTYGSRLCFIGNMLYLVHEAGVNVYDYETFSVLDGISF